MKDSKTAHILGSKGISDKSIKDYYVSLKNIRRAVHKNSDDQLATESLYELPNGFRFFFQEWRSSLKNHEKIPKCIVFVFHGIYSHSDLFYILADALSPYGVMVVGIDYRGHGRTGGMAGGQLGDLSGFDEIIDDFQKIVWKYKQEYALPTYFVGWNLGALIAMQVAIKFPELDVNGLIFLSPAWKLKEKLKNFFFYPFYTIGRVFTKGELYLDVPKEPIEKTYFPEYAAHIENDPLLFKKMSLRMQTSITNFIISSRKLIKKANFPLLILQGTADPVIDHFAVYKQLFQKWPHPNKLIRLYENGGYNLLVDKFTGEIFQEIRKIINVEE
jgi:alpha-beta hydrolase superfamily lysophospholipase